MKMSEGPNKNCLELSDKSKKITKGVKQVFFNVDRSVYGVQPAAGFHFNGK